MRSLGLLIFVVNLVVENSSSTKNRNVTGSISILAQLMSCDIAKKACSEM